MAEPLASEPVTASLPADVDRGPQRGRSGTVGTQLRGAFVPGPHRVARMQEGVQEFLEPRLRQRGWRDTIVPYTCYGTGSWVRVMARLLLRRPEHEPGRAHAVRGWRSFATVPVSCETVLVDVGDRQHEVRTDRGGYIDVVVAAGLEPGWRSIRLHRVGAEPVEAPVRILAPDVRFAVVSDIDDTIMVTALPRPLLAAWNTFVLDEYARSPVPGMAVLYERLVTAHPEAPVFYLSTGAWNVAPALTRFLSRNLYPFGPLPRRSPSAWPPPGTDAARSPDRRHIRTPLSLPVDHPAINLPGQRGATADRPRAAGRPGRHHRAHTSTAVRTDPARRDRLW